MNQIPSSSALRQKPFTSLYNLIRSHPSLQSPIEQRQAELIAALSLSSALLDFIFVTFSLILRQWSALLLGTLIFFAVSSLAYIVSRSRRYSQAPVIFVLGLAPAVYLASFVSPASTIIPILAFAFLFLLSNLFELKLMTWVVLPNMVLAILGSILFMPGLEGIERIIFPVSMVALATFVLLFAWHRNTLERLRLGEVEAARADLERSNLGLQQAQREVNARLAEIRLAAEVGRAVSQVRSLDEMLTDAVERIRQQFNLYYVQVYLLSPSQTALVLQAGTGEVGAALLERKHQLPLNTGSINGRAAVDKDRK